MAGADDLVTYLRLSPEFGGTRFGPFEGLEVRLGSNAERCHIVLAESRGVQPEHAKLIRQNDNSLILTPAERTATIFLWKSGSRRPSQLYTPTAVRPGDAFALVTQDGPKFIIELDELPPEVKEQRDAAKRVATGRRRLSAASMGNEVKRQAWTRLLVLGPAQMLQRAAVFVRSGAIYQPRNIIFGLTLLGGYIFGGAALCSRSKYKSQVVKIEQESSSCQQQLEIAKSLGGNSTEYDFPELATTITQSFAIGNALKEDAELRGEVKKKSKILFATAKSYDWLVNPRQKKANEFAKWRETITESDAIDPDTAALLVWLAADPAPISAEFGDFEDSNTNEVCGRGVLKMTYRQAVHLGMNTQPDAFIKGDPNAVNEDRAERERLLSQSIALAGGDPLPDNFETDVVTVRQGTAHCVSVTGTDERMQYGAIARALGKQLGEESAGVPDPAVHWAPSSRLAKYWSADFEVGDWSGREIPLDFTQATTGALLASQGSNGKWALERTAETIAKAIVIPCLGALNGDPKEFGKVIGESKIPSAVNCLVLDWKLRNEG